MQEIVYHNNYRLEDTYWWFVARQEILKKLIKRFTTLKKQDSVLDVGCGTGGFASYISSDFNVIGLEPEQIALEYCRKRGLTNLIHGTLDDFNKLDWDIKAILMLDVVEHIEDDKGVVKQVYDNLPEGGYFITTVPAYMWLWSQHDVIHMHKRRYTKPKYLELLENSGFKKIIYSSYFNTFLFFPAVLKRFVDKITGKRNEESVEEVSPLLNTIFTKIFMFESKFLHFFRLPFGVSIVVIAQK